MLFYNHHRNPPARIGYHIERDRARQSLRVTPFQLTDAGEKIRFDSGAFTFAKETILADKYLAPYWDLHACWGLETRANPFALGHLYPVFPQTILHKAPYLTQHPLFERPVLFYVPFRESTIDEIAVLCYPHADAGVDGEPARKIDSRIQLERDLLPRLEFRIEKTCPADATVEGEVSLLAPAGGERVDRDGTVYLEHDAGYVNRTKLALRNGTARFLFRAQLLEPGETVTLKAGFKHYTGKTSARVLVT